MLFLVMLGLLPCFLLCAAGDGDENHGVEPFVWPVIGTLHHQLKQERPNLEHMKNWLTCHGNPDVLDVEGHTPLWVIINEPTMIRIQLVPYLFEHGANPHWRDENNRTYLHCIAQYWWYALQWGREAGIFGYERLIRTLHEKGVDATLVDIEGNTVATWVQKTIAMIRLQSVKPDSHIEKQCSRLLAAWRGVLPELKRH